MARSEQLILIPGFGSDEALWHHQTTHLRDIAECRVAVPDQDDTVSATAERLLDEIAGGFSLVGQSMGGFVAQEMVRRAPDRIERLALVCTSARPNEGTAAVNKGTLSSAISQFFTLDDEQNFVATRKEVIAATLYADAVDREPGHILETMLTRVLSRPGVFHRQLNAIATRPDGRPHLAAIRCPTVVITGRDDKWMAPDLAVEMAQNIPGAAMVFIEQAAHAPAIEQPQATTAVLRYWLQQGRGT